MEGRRRKSVLYAGGGDKRGLSAESTREIEKKAGEYVFLESLPGVTEMGRRQRGAVRIWRSPVEANYAVILY